MRKTITASAFSIALYSLGASASVTLPAFDFYASEAAFTGATGLSAFESFEGLSGAPRSGSSVVVGGFSVIPVGPALLGLQTGAQTPEPGNGANSTHGTNYLLSYLPNQATGALRFEFNSPVTAFGLNLVDVGEAVGTVVVQINSGELNSPFAAFTFTAQSLLANGNVLFLGFSQSTSFSSVTLTVNGIDDSYGLDKVYVQTVPEPGQSALLLAGLLALSRAVRRRISQH